MKYLLAFLVILLTACTNASAIRVYECDMTIICDGVGRAYPEATCGDEAQAQAFVNLLGDECAEYGYFACETSTCDVHCSATDDVCTSLPAVDAGMP